MSAHLFPKGCWISLLVLLTGICHATQQHELYLAEKKPGRAALFTPNDRFNKVWVFNRFLTPDADGHVSFSTESKGFSPFQIRTSSFKYEIWFSSDENIQAKLLPPDTLRNAGFYELQQGTVQFLQGGKFGMEMNTINNWVDSFTTANYKLMIVRRLRPALLAFDSSLQKTPAYAGLSENGKEYYRWQLAPLFVASSEKSKEIFEKYFSGKTDPENPFYLDFVRYFFKGYLYALMGRSKNENIERDVNAKASLDELLRDIHKEAPQMQNDTLLQLVLLQEMRAWYNEKQNIPSSVLSIIKQIKEKALHPAIAFYAGNTEVSLTKMEKGSPVPCNGYTDANGNAYTLSPAKTVPLVLVFCNSNSPEFQRELPLFEKAILRQAGQVEFRFFYMDEKEPAFPSFLKKDWVVHTAYDHCLLWNAGVRSLPFMVVLAPDGTLVKYDAPLPSKGLNEWLSRYIKTGKT